jgi:hypothetical protein
MIRRPGGVGQVWRRRSPADSRTRSLHALLDRALAAGVAPVELESDIADLLSMAKRREQRDGLTAKREGVTDHGLPQADSDP